MEPYFKIAVFIGTLVFVYCTVSEEQAGISLILCAVTMIYVDLAFVMNEVKKKRKENK